MIDPSTTNGKRIAMIAWAKKGDGEDDVAVFSGIADWDGRKLILRRQPDSASFMIPDEWLSRLKPVDDELRMMLFDAEYCFSVSVGVLDTEEDSVVFRKTGLKWPSSNKDAG